MSDDFEGGEINLRLLKLAFKVGKKAFDSKCSKCWTLIDVGYTPCCNSRMCVNCIQKYTAQEKFLFFQSNHFLCPSCNNKVKLS